MTCLFAESNHVYAKYKLIKNFSNVESILFDLYLGSNLSPNVTGAPAMEI